MYTRINNISQPDAYMQQEDLCKIVNIANYFVYYNK